MTNPVHYQNPPKSDPSSTTGKSSYLGEKIILGLIGLFLGFGVGVAYAIPIAIIGSGIAFLWGASTATIQTVALSLFVTTTLGGTILMGASCANGKPPTLAYCGC